MVEISEVVVVAHRGASHQVPENTLAAVRRAIRTGADRVEFDVQRTKDGHLVVLHDTTLDRTTDAAHRLPGRGPWPLSDHTLAEVRSLDAGGWMDWQWNGERVPTLDSVLDVLDRAGIGAHLELKSPERYPGVVLDLVDVLSHHHGDVLVQSFDEAVVRDLKDARPELRVGLLGRPSRWRLGEIATWAAQVNPPHTRTDRRFVDLLHRHGLECYPWTVNRPPAMRRLLALGVDGIITDRPVVLRELTAGVAV